MTMKGSCYVELEGVSGGLALWWINEVKVIVVGVCKECN